eukprot:1156511-Pelagomonas_calceolata.AAC.2
MEQVQHKLRSTKYTIDAKLQCSKRNRPTKLGQHRPSEQAEMQQMWLAPAKRQNDCNKLRSRCESGAVQVHHIPHLSKLMQH